VKVKDAIKGILPALSSVLPDEKILRCACGSSAWFDWGIQIVTKTTSGPSPRFADYAGQGNVKICANCHRAAVIWDGDLYDASEYVSSEEIDSIIEKAQMRQHTVPAKVMDP
jgi:hypothetical protein